MISSSEMETNEILKSLRLIKSEQLTESNSRARRKWIKPFIERQMGCAVEQNKQKTHDQSWLWVINHFNQ